MDGNDNTISRGVEFRRQLRSGQLRRFVGLLPPYAVQPELPDRFVDLLRELDRVAQNAGSVQCERPVLQRE